MPIPGEMTEAELSAFLGIAPTTVREYAAPRQGVIVRTRPGRFDVRESVLGYTASLRDRASRIGRTPAGGDADALKAEKLKLTAAQREAQEMKNATIRGDLVSADEVKAGWASILTDVRAGMLAIPARLPELTPDQRAKLDAEIRLALERLSHG